ncbi:MAG: hypothetical protein AAFX76_08465 [Planctomycetota bacterium]
MRELSEPGPETEKAVVRPRPAWLRALGRDDPPAEVEVAGEAWHRVTVYKHDAFAATALYARVDDPEHRLIAKFARRQPAFGVPMGWLGMSFHRREQRVLSRMAGVAGVPRSLGPVGVAGRIFPGAAAREYVPGRPMTIDDRPDDDYFPELERLIATFHDRRVAVVDLNKIDNLLIGDDGRPHLFDFQISLAPADLPAGWRWIDPRSWLLPGAKRADRYHLMKHRVRRRPDQLTADQLDLDRLRPVSVRLWRKLVRPMHVARRRLFVALRIRTGRGDPETEVGPEARGQAETHPSLPPAADSPEPARTTTQSP